MECRNNVVYDWLCDHATWFVEDECDAKIYKLAGLDFRGILIKAEHAAAYFEDYIQMHHEIHDRDVHVQL